MVTVNERTMFSKAARTAPRYLQKTGGNALARAWLKMHLVPGYIISDLPLAGFNAVIDAAAIVLFIISLQCEWYVHGL